MCEYNISICLVLTCYRGRKMWHEKAKSESVFFGVGLLHGPQRVDPWYTLWKNKCMDTFRMVVANNLIPQISLPNFLSKLATIPI